MAAAILGIALVGVSILAMAVLHVIGRRVSAVARTMSEYALIGWPQRILLGVTVLSLAGSAVILLFLSLDHIVAVVALALAALGLAASAFALTDDMDPALGDYKPSVHGSIHNVGALLAFLGTIVAAFALMPTFADPTGGILIGLLPLAGTIFFVITVALQNRRARSGRPSIHGIGERVALAALWAWYVLALLAAVQVI